MNRKLKLHINDLPNEMLGHIFSFHSCLEDRANCGLVCRRWDELIYDRQYLGRIHLTLTVNNMSPYIQNLPKITRPYRNIRVKCCPEFPIMNKSKLLSSVIEELPLERLELENLRHYIFFHDLSTVTNITTLVLIRCKISETALERLCKCCPLLVKFRFDADGIRPMRYLVNLKYLKVCFRKL